jgi:hypothetical protein
MKRVRLGGALVVADFFGTRIKEIEVIFIIFNL